MELGLDETGKAMKAQPQIGGLGPGPDLDRLAITQHQDNRRSAVMASSRLRPSRRKPLGETSVSGPDDAGRPSVVPSTLA